MYSILYFLDFGDERSAETFCNRFNWFLCRFLFVVNWIVFAMLTENRRQYTRLYTIFNAQTKENKIFIYFFILFCSIVINRKQTSMKLSPRICRFWLLFFISFCHYLKWQTREHESNVISFHYWRLSQYFHGKWGIEKCCKRMKHFHEQFLLLGTWWRLL